MDLNEHWGEFVDGASFKDTMTPFPYVNILCAFVGPRTPYLKRVDLGAKETTWVLPKRQCYATSTKGSFKPLFHDDAELSTDESSVPWDGSFG